MFTNLNKYREQIFPDYAFYWLVGFCSLQNNKTQVKNKKKMMLKKLFKTSATSDVSYNSTRDKWQHNQLCLNC